MGKIILASKSPRRSELLESMKIAFEAIPSAVQESLKEGEDPKDGCMRLALAKAFDVCEKVDGQSAEESWVIGADTLVVVNGTALGIPKSYDQARHMLRMLSGREHWVFTSFAVVNSVTRGWEAELVGTLVKMKEVDEQEIERYLQTGEPFDKAGAYAIQGIGAFMVEKIFGSYTNVVGLPMAELIQVLIKMGAIPGFPGKHEEEKK
ncbi:MAG: septum formation protein Maf [Nitrospirae bacterium]|nr:septum formation protein Maf [Nitrospirota bacterium]